MHVHLWDTLEQGGAGVSPEEASRARIRTVVGSLVYAAIATFCVLLLPR